MPTESRQKNKMSMKMTDSLPEDINNTALIESVAGDLLLGAFLDQTLHGTAFGYTPGLTLDQAERLEEGIDPEVVFSEVKTAYGITQAVLDAAIAWRIDTMKVPTT